MIANISQKLRIKWNFELTVIESTVPDLYLVISNAICLHINYVPLSFTTKLCVHSFGLFGKSCHIW